MVNRRLLRWSDMSALLARPERSGTRRSRRMGRAASSPAPLMLVGATKRAVGTSAEVYLDGGVMNGADIVAATALGADGVFVGRAYLYGLMAGGEDGVRRVADLLTADIMRTMALLGVTTVADLEPAMVRLP